MLLVCTMKPTTKMSGFTLVELSIVLVIVGLLIAGVLAGQSLIEAAKVRSITSEFSQYMSMFDQFKVKYKYYPGDLPNATGMFGAANACNGNGNGRVGYSHPTYWEHTESWNHLRLIGLLKNTRLTGCKNTTACAACNQINETVPALSADKKLGIGIDYEQAGVPFNVFLGGSGGHTLGTIAGYRIIFMGVDQKLDDGKGTTGTIRAAATGQTAGDLGYGYGSIEYVYPTGHYMVPNAEAAVYRLSIDATNFLSTK